MAYIICLGILLILCCIYSYRTCVIKHLLICGSNMVDIYLRYKYRNYQYVKLKKDYVITRVKYISPTSHITDISDHFSHCDISCEFDCDSLKDMVSGGERDGIFEVHFRYGDDEFIYPFKYSPNTVINFPLYDIDDLETCMKSEYDIDYPDLSQDNRDIILKYSGPKGNFYCDIDRSFEPSMMLDTNGKCIIEDHITLTTITGNVLTFKQNEKIIIRN